MNRVLSLLLCIVHLCVLTYLARQHPFGTYATETDFYHFFAPDAERLASGRFPFNPYQGPGYPAILAALGKLLGLSNDLFTLGKWLSVICAVACGWLCYRLFALALSHPHGEWIGLGAQLLFIVSGDFPQYSISATTDVFFLLICLAALVVLLNERYALVWRTITAALLSGVAYLTRYNGLFLVVACLLGIVFFNLYQRPWRTRWQHAALFVGLLFLLCLPWFIANARVNGSPLYNTNYLNLATEFYPELVKGKVNQDGTRALEERFRSFSDVVRHDPQRMLTHYPKNLWESLRNFGTARAETSLLHPAVMWLALVGLLLACWREWRNARWQLLFGAGVLYLLLMALNHWEARYYFFVLVLCAGLVAYAVLNGAALLNQRFGGTATGWSFLSALVLLVVMGLALRDSATRVREFLASHPAEVLAARDFLQRAGKCPAATNGARPSTAPVIVARKPHLAYLCRAQWVFFPQVESLEDLRTWLAANPIDYLLVSPRELKDRKKLRSLSDPNKAPEWLTAAWANKDPLVILYQPQ